VEVVNRLRAKYFAKSRLQRTKSDPADVRLLAVLGMSTRPTPRELPAGSEWRKASRFVMPLVTEQAKVCQRLQRLIDLGFPELGDVFEDPGCASAVAVLRLAPTAAAVRRKQSATLAAVKAPGGKRSLGAKKAAELKALAERSVAPPELEEQTAFEISVLVSQHDLLESQINLAETRLASLLDDDVARRLQSIPGVGPATAAALMAEIGDIWRFDDVDQLLAYAGVHPREASSGQKGSNPESSWHMAKSGNVHLRTPIYRMALVGTQHNPVIAAHYRRKREAGRSK
jgi:transposase